MGHMLVIEYRIFGCKQARRNTVAFYWGHILGRFFKVAEETIVSPVCLPDRQQARNNSAAVFLGGIIKKFSGNTSSVKSKKKKTGTVDEDLRIFGLFLPTLPSAKTYDSNPF
jgi:hypothetical protein